MLPGTPPDSHFLGMIPGRIFRFVGVLLFLIQNDESRIAGRKYRTAGSNDYFRLASAHPFPLVMPFPGRQAGMEHRHLLTKVGCQKSQQLGCQGNFRHQ